MSSLIVVSRPRAGGAAPLARYVEGVLPLIVGAGGVVLKRLRITEAIEGDPAPGFVFVADFPDAASIRALFAGEEYRTLLADRDAGFESIDIYVTEDN